MRGSANHVSDQKISTTCTTTLEKARIYSGWNPPVSGSLSAVPNLLCLRFGDVPTQGREESVLPHQGGQGLEGELRAPPEVLGVFPQWGATEASWDQVVVRFMPGFLYGHVPEETIIYTHDVVCPGLHLPPQPEHAPRPLVLAPWAPSRDEVGRHIF